MDIRKLDAYKAWQRECERIQNAQTAAPADTDESRRRRISRARTDYAYFVSTYFPDIARCKCARFQIDAAKWIKANPNTRAVFEWARGHAKSTHMDLLVPLWLKIQDKRQFHTMVVVSKSEEAATRLLADLQQQLQYNQLFERDFGHQIKVGSWAEGEFQTEDGYYFVALGRGQSPRGLKANGHRPDYIVIDDLDDDEMVRNPKRVSDCTEWVLTALFGTMEAGRGRFIMVGNRIAKNSVLSRIIERPGVHHTRVNMLDSEGNPSWRENYTIKEIQEMRQMIGERNFEREYMNNPTTEGAVFSAKHIHYGPMLPLQQYRQLVCYTDPSFKNSATADYKATMLVGITPRGQYHLLKAYADQTSVAQMVAWHYDIMQYVGGRVPTLYYIESNFMQDLMLDEFRKVGDALGHHVPIQGDRRKKPDKFARIEAMQPLFERGLVIFNELERNTDGMKTLVEQMMMFERGTRAHDDAPDALESAIWVLSQRARHSCATYERIGSRRDRRW